MTTTLGGWHTRDAGATSSSQSARRRAPVVVAADPVEAAFLYADLLEPVAYQLGFEPDARDAAVLTAACASLLEVAAPEPELQDLAAPIVAFCRHGHEADAEQAPDAYVAYREAAFALSG